MSHRRHATRPGSRPARERQHSRSRRPHPPSRAPGRPEELHEIIAVYAYLGTSPGAGLAAGGTYASETRATMGTVRQAKFRIGDVVRHRVFPFRGVIFDVDPVFANTEEWWESIPAEIRPRKDQPFYHLLAESEDTTYVAYVSEQNLLPDETGKPSKHPEIGELFAELKDGRYVPRARATN